MNNENKKATVHQEKKSLLPEQADVPLTDEELNAASGGRITNIRVNANGLTGGGPIPANAVAQ